MIDVGVIITGAVGMVSTIVGSWTSWFFARKKYNTEVDSNEIDNLKKSLEFYNKIVADNNKKLQFYIRLSETNSVEVYRLKGIVHRLLNNSCLDHHCSDRKYYTEEQIREILGEMTLEAVKKEENNEIDTSERIS